MNSQNKSQAAIPLPKYSNVERLQIQLWGKLRAILARPVSMRGTKGMARDVQRDLYSAAELRCVRGDLDGGREFLFLAHVAGWLIGDGELFARAGYIEKYLHKHYGVVA